MYYSMKNIGDDTAEKLRKLSGVDEKWHCIADTAGYLGVSGLHLSPEYQTEYGLPFDNIPAFIRNDFRLTCHWGYHYHLYESEDVISFQTMLETSLATAVKSGMEDVSIHPPLLANIAITPEIRILDTPDLREETRNRLQECLAVWGRRFREHGITLSLESHITSSYFVFTNMADYSKFISSVPGIGALVDIAHNFYDGYTMPDILEELKNVRITGFHISDAIRGIPLRGQRAFRPFHNGNDRKIQPSCGG